MTAQEYIDSKLEELRKPSEALKPDKEELVDEIFRLIMSKKFRKYSAKPELQEHMKSAIKLNVENNEPINLTFLHGAYKLWRLDEAPEVDWAELFALMYYSSWVKPVCAIYEPGVWFDFFVDDLIVPKLNNVDIKVVEDYLASYKKLMDFLKPYQPENLKMTYTTVGSRFNSPEAFEESLQKNMAATSKELPVLTEQEKAMVELNTKVTEEQSRDLEWREKVFHLHNAYSQTKAEPGYHNQPTKIKVFTQPLPTGMVMSVGTTKDSVAKFWVGVGALSPRDDSFRQIILSPSQLEKSNFNWEDMNIEGLSGKNFSKIRVLR